MSSKTKHRYRKWRQFSFPKRLTVLALLVPVCLFTWHYLIRKHDGLGRRSGADQNASVHSLAPQAASANPQAKLPVFPVRPVYPYSIIPGGAKNVPELQTAIANDHTVAAHYFEFHIEKARVVKLNRNLSAHVSYRLGNRVYWTKKQLKIAKGETVITDGEHMARTRCGNQIAINLPPLSMISPHEPTQAQLDMPVPPDVFQKFPSDVIARAIQPISDPGDPALPLPPSFFSSPNPLPPGSSNPIPYIPVPIGSPNSPPNSPPVVKLPEPGTFELLLIALSALWGFKRRTRNAKIP